MLESGIASSAGSGDGGMGTSGQPVLLYLCIIHRQLPIKVDASPWVVARGLGQLPKVNPRPTVCIFVKYAVFENASSWETT